jgi:hypothetical protein
MAESFTIDAESMALMSAEDIEAFKQAKPGAQIDVVKSDTETAAPADGHPELDSESFGLMSAEDLAAFAQQTKWSPYVWAQTNPEKLDDAALTKLGKTDVLLRKQGWKLSDIPFETIATAIPHMAEGIFTAGKKLATSGGLAAPFVGALSPVVAAPLQRELTGGEQPTTEETKSRLELAAGLETEAVGFADLFRRTYNRLGRFLDVQKPLEQLTDEDAKELFSNELSARNQLLQVSSGEGEVTKWLGGSKLAELKRTGFKLDPEEINKVSAAGILTLPVFGGAFKLVNAATGKIVGTALSESAAVRALANIRALRKFEAGAEKLAADIPSAENVAARSAAQIKTGAAREAAIPLVQALEVGERTVAGLPGAPQIVGRAAQASGKTIEALAKGASAVLPGIKYFLGARAAQKAGAGLAKAGEAIATEAGGGTWTRAMQDVLRVPGKVVGGALTHGAPMDIGLLALTAETPEEAQQTPLMGTAFGGIGGLIRAGKGFAQGQLIAARPWGDSNTWTKNYGNFPELDRLHAETMKIASPGVKQRVGGIRDLANATGAEVYQFSGPESMSQAMQSFGIDKASADNAANTSGVAWRNVVDSQGNRRKVILLRDPKSAPHEVGHPLEDIFTPEQQDELHARIAKAYGDEGLLQRAQQESFALATTPEAQARVQQDWMAFLLDENGDGPALAKVKGDTLTTEDMQNAVRKYAAKEILVDTIGAVIEHGTPEMVRDAGVPGIVAKTIAKAFTLLGADPFSGAKYGVLETPLKAPVVEGVKETIAPFAVEGAAPTRVTKPTITPTPRVTTTTPPVSEDKTANAEQARAVAEKASDVPLVADAQSPKQVVSELANAIETGAGVKLTRLSAGEKGIAEPGEAGGAEDLSASLLSNREARRHVIEEFRTMPESAKALTERNLFPDAVWEGKSGELLMRGWAPEVFAANAHKTARVLAELQKAGVSIGDITSLPLDPATGSFTDAGWRQLFDQLSGVVENQKAGATGAGEPLVVPRSATAQGFRAPEQRGVAVPIDQNVADFVNLLFGFRLPKTGMIRGKPLTFAGQKVSEATAPGRAVPRVSAGATEFAGKKAEELGIAGEPIQEINPLRARLQQKIAEARKAGVRVSEPELFESLQQFRVSDIKKVEAAPEIPEFRGNTLTLTAGFTPSSNPRAIKIAAVEDAEGKIYTGAWHGEAFTKARDAGAKPIGYYDIEGLKEPFYREGFLTGEEEFLDRESAAQRAIELGQLNRRAKETTERLGGLESQTFKKGRQFTPAPAKVPVELTGPDGKKYKVTFDGYWDLRSLGRGQEPAFTALENLPGSVSQNSSTMGKSLTDAGYRLPELPKPEFTSGERVDSTKNEKPAGKKAKSKTELKFKPGAGGFSKAWIFPDATVKQLGGQWHHEYVNENPELMQRYGLKSTESGEENRNQALQKGFARVNYDNRSGHLTVEARQKDWRKLKNTVYDLIERNIDDVDRVTISLMDDSVQKVVDSAGESLFKFDDEREKLENIPFITKAGVEPRGQFTPGKKFESETFDRELEKIRAGESGGQTFTAEGEVWSPEGKNLDVVTLASVNLPSGKVTRESVIEALGAYEELLDEPGVVAGVFSFSKGGKPTVSVDINATVPQKYRANSVDFAKQNDQVSIWDSAKMEEVPTGGKGETKLQTVAEILDAFDSLTRGKKVNVEEIQRQYEEPGAVEEEIALPGLEEIAGKKVIAGSVVAKMTKAEMARQFPELVIPRRRNEKLSSEITESPLYKAAGSEEVAIKSFGRKLVEFAREYSEHPSYKAGLEWYEKFTPLLKKHFGKDSQLFAELLAATSPQTNVTTNFAYAFDALEGFKSGRFKKPMEKFNQALDMINDGSWEAWYKRNKFKKEPTPARFLEEWLKKFDAKPRQSNGKFYGQHSIPVLQVFTRKWLDANRGPKTLNFVENLLGTGAEATIDLWADRTMRRVGYSGAADRWRIHPSNQGAVSDRDFFFAQKAFRAAAEELGIKPSALQGALWFAEKQYWNEQGWSTLDLGDFRKEIERIPALRAKIKRQLKDKPKEQLGFDLVEPRNKDK